MHRSSHGHMNNHLNSHGSRRYEDEDVEELEQYLPPPQQHYGRPHSPYMSHSPIREDSYIFGPYCASHYELTDPEDTLRLKWMDNSARMSRLREHRYKRLINKLEQFELWDIEQEQKQKQYELAREQRYKNIMERLKSQEFCVNLMKKRHESDLETTRELEIYSNDHLYVDPLDDPKTNTLGPVTQYRKFQAEMDDKLRNLQNDMDVLNPRYRIEQDIIPRLERTRIQYSIEPEIYTSKGKRVLKRPNLRNKFSSEDRDDYRRNYLDESHGIRFYYPPVNEVRKHEKLKLKPIIHSNSSSNVSSNSNSQDNVKQQSKAKVSNGQERKMVNFKEDVEYSNGKNKPNGKHDANENGDS